MNQYQNLQKELYLENGDMNFIQYLISEITEDGLLPFSLPPQIFPRIIKNSALWFYEESDDAVQERWFYIKSSDIPKHDGSRNTVITLPPTIQAVWDIKPTTSNVHGSIYKFKQDPLLYGGSSNSLGGISHANPYKRANRDIGIESYFAHIYESQLFKTLLGRSFPFDFSQLSGELVLMDDVSTTGLVLKTFTRLPISALYNSSRFRKHVIGSSYKKLKRILNQFDFQYPGDVKINFEDIEQEGADMVKEIEELVRSESDASDLILMK